MFRVVVLVLVLVSVGMLVVSVLVLVLILMLVHVFVSVLVSTLLVNTWSSEHPDSIIEDETATAAWPVLATARLPADCQDSLVGSQDKIEVKTLP